jgi:hypothetical protein
MYNVSEFISMWAPHVAKFLRWVGDLLSIVCALFPDPAQSRSFMHRGCPFFSLCIVSMNFIRKMGTTFLFYALTNILAIQCRQKDN